MEVGQSLGRLTVVGFAGRDKHGHKIWKVRCSCGTEKTMQESGLQTAKSCGCKRAEDFIRANNARTISRRRLHNSKAPAQDDAAEFFFE